MPIYEYRCENCHHQFEELQKVDDLVLVHCESCGKDCLVKLVSAAGFQLKGTGWYVTDFKDSGKKAEPSKTADGKESSSAANTAEAKTTEAKPVETSKKPDTSSDSSK